MKLLKRDVILEPVKTCGVSPATCGVSPAKCGVSPATCGVSPAKDCTEVCTEVCIEASATERLGARWNVPTDAGRRGWERGGVGSAGCVRSAREVRSPAQVFPMSAQRPGREREQRGVILRSGDLECPVVGGPAGLGAVLVRIPAQWWWAGSAWPAGVGGGHFGARSEAEEAGLIGRAHTVEHRSREAIPQRPKPPPHRTVSGVGYVALACLTLGCALAIGCGTADFVASERAIDATPLPRPGTNARCLVVLTSEFGAAGGLDVMDVDTFEIHRDRIAAHHDAVLSVEDDQVVVINRLGGDNIQMVDPASGFGTSAQLPLGANSNPWGWYRADERAYVPLYGSGEVAEFELAEAGWMEVGRTRIAVDEPDGRAEVAGVIVGSRPWALTQGIGEFPHCRAGDRTQLHALDSTDDVLELAACNASADVVLRGSSVLVASAGNNRSLGFADDDGGLEVADLDTLRTSGLLVGEADIGGQDFLGVYAGETRIWALTADSDFGVHVREVTWSADTVAVSEPVFSGEGIFAVAERYGRLWVADRHPDNPGIVQLDVETGETLFGGQRIRTTFPPFGLGFVELPSACVVP